MTKKEPISYQDTLEVIKRLIEIADKRNEPFKEPIVMLGGSAMMAHSIRKQSYDVDLYVSEFTDDVVHQAEEEFKKKFGNAFRIDITSVENIWGSIMLRDICNSEPTSKISYKNQIIFIRKLSVEDIFLLKLDTGREKDINDLPLLYEKTTVNNLIDRFNIIAKWHGTRDAIMGYADKFVSTIKELGNQDAIDIIERLKLSEFILDELKATYNLDYYDNNPIS